MGIAEGADYELAWPSDLVAFEMQALVDRGWDRNADHVEPLLREAFRTGAPLDDFRRWQASARADDPWSSRSTPQTGTDQSFLAPLLAALPDLPQHVVSRPYWIQRVTAQEATDPLPNTNSVKRQFVRLIGDLEDLGYLSHAFPKPCANRPFFNEVDRDQYFKERLGIDGLWPLQPDSWTDDVFYSLVEVFYDLVARPRYWQWHDWDECGWHYKDYSVEPARTLCAWHINRLLTSYKPTLELASAGEDAGRLVHTFDVTRSELLATTISKEKASGDRLRHAIALFRGRAATLEDRRSATVALAGILEENRALLRSELFRRDEGALFQIANEFEIRHRTAAQHSDYDGAFVDWVFWWYLATIDLVHRLLARQASSGTQN